MEAGRVDLALGLIPDLKAGFFQRRLFRHRHVCMFRKGHPLDKGRMTLQEFTNADHVVVVATGTGRNRMDAMLDDSGVRRRIRLRLPHFVAVGHILSETDMIASVPERFALRCAAPFEFTYVAHAAKLPDIQINLSWHAKFHLEPGNRWLRTLIFDTFSGGRRVDSKRPRQLRVAVKRMGTSQARGISSCWQMYLHHMLDL